jgi:hypothetical protein
MVHASLATTKRFYERHPRWLAAQVGLVLLALFVGTESLVVGVVGGIAIGLGAGVVSLIASVGLGLAGIFVVPAWRDRVEERRWN